MKAAIWTRVSTEEQEGANQERQLLDLARARSLEVVQTYRVTGSAYRGQHQRELSQLYRDAHRGRFEALLVWALDRLSRQGIAAIIGVLSRLEQLGVRVISHQEAWLDTGGPARDLLLAVMGWVAQQEAVRLSERTKAGMERARAEGKRIGRPPGRKDSKKRQRRGYFERYAREEWLKKRV